MKQMDVVISDSAKRSKKTRSRVQRFDEMAEAQATGACHLSPNSAILDQTSQFDEPFVILGADKKDELLAAIQRAGKHWPGPRGSHRAMTEPFA